MNWEAEGVLYEWSLASTYCMCCAIAECSDGSKDLETSQKTTRRQEETYCSRVTKGENKYSIVTSGMPESHEGQRRVILVNIQTKELSTNCRLI